VEAFVSGIARNGKVLTGHGQCIQQYGSGEAYLPILEALTRLGRDAGAAIAAVLREHAPSWLAHLPSLGQSERLEGTAPVTPARMLRELAEALEVLTARDPLILVLEDLHWSDAATLEWLAYAARRRDAARLLLVGTYRPVEALLHNQPLRSLIAELRRHPQCSELALDYLTHDAVEAYVRLRFGDVARVAEAVGVLSRRTGGHPLFLTAVADQMRRQWKPGDSDLLVMANVVPAGVRQFIEHQFEQLSAEDAAILGGASVAGDPFSVAAVAAATGMPEERIEARSAALANERRFLRPHGAITWPDGTLAEGFAFRHALYQEVIYASVSPERRARFHRRVGERLERAHRNHVAAIAAQLAMHFEHARDPWRATRYLVYAARNAIERSAYPEARGHLERGRALLQLLPEGRERSRRELHLLLLLGRVLAATKGWAVEEVESVFLRARELCSELRDASSLLQALWGLIGVTFVGADFRKAHGLGRQVLGIAKTLGDPVYEILGHMEVGGTAFHLGEATAAAERHFRKAEELYNPAQHRSHLAVFGVDMGLFSRSWASHLLWYRGYPDQARAKADDTLRLAREVAHPLTRAVALAYAAMLHQFCRDVRQVQALAEAAIGLCSEHGFPYYLAWAGILRGWSRVATGALDEGISEIRRGIKALEAKAGARLPYYRSLLAESCASAGDIGEALQSLDRAFVETHNTEERWWEPELLRVRGELLRSESVERGVEAETNFREAIDLARKQGAKCLELRAAVSLCRLCRERGRRREGSSVVAGVYGWFTEGFDLADLNDAKPLVETAATEASFGGR